MFQINPKLIPLKGHYFFFMAAMGTILPHLSVYGKELGINCAVMGTVFGILSQLLLFVKPTFDFIVKHYIKYKKAIFMTLIIIMSLSYVLLYFIPTHFENVLEFQWNKNQLDYCAYSDFHEERKCLNSYRYYCEIQCETSSFFKSIPQPHYEYGNKIEEEVEKLAKIQAIVNDEFLETGFFDFRINRFCVIGTDFNASTFTCGNKWDVVCWKDNNINVVNCIYGTEKFWDFVILISIGTMCFYFVQSISDDICSDVLGNGHQIMDCEKQRVWGTIGFGLCGLLSGYIIDYIFFGTEKTYTPAFVIILICIAIDLVFCWKLQLPVAEVPIAVAEAPKNTFKEFQSLLKNKPVSIFLAFAVCTGILESLIIYYLFWHLENLATASRTKNMKILEGLTVAAQTLSGGVIFLPMSEKIFKKIRSGHSLSICFIVYALRLGLVSFMSSPWWILPIELILAGSSSTLAFTTITANATALSAPGVSAIMQGLVIGSFFGGLLYYYASGITAFRVSSGFGLLCGTMHFVLYRTILKKNIPKADDRKIENASPEEAVQDIGDDPMPESSTNFTKNIIGQSFEMIPS